MKKIEWKDEFSVGNPILDNQHKEPVQLINHLQEESEHAGMITYAFDSLDRYVDVHFRTEENILEDASYADLKAHKIEHKPIETWLKSVKTTFAVGASPLSMAEVVNNYLQDWLINHILHSDMDYRETLNLAAVNKKQLQV